MSVFDDVLAVCTTELKALSFFDRFAAASSPHFRLEREKVASTVQFLDLEVFMIRQGFRPRLSFRPFIKPSAKHIPLGSDSFHPRSIHRSWPLSEVKRMHARSDSLLDFRKFREIKLNRWKYFFMDPAVIATCSAWLPVGPTLRNIACPVDALAAKVCVRDLIVRIILPWHPAHRSLARTLRAIAERFDVLFRPFGIRIVPSVSFKRGAKPLMYQLRHLKV